MRAGFISWDEAVEAIAEEVESVYKHLEQGGDYGFGRLGRLVLVDGNVCFQPQENNSIENPRFGFSLLEITPREEDAEDREIPTVEAEKVRVKDISKTDYCPLAKQVRKRLKLEGISSGVKVVYSFERPDYDSVKMTDGSNFKKSFYGTNSWMPALFGLHAAETVVKHLIGMTSPK
jgi:hypothetical protein